MITERTIINALLIGASLIMAPFIISESLSYDYVPAEILGGLFALVIAFFVLKDALCICPLLGLNIAGGLNFLPLGLDAATVACILLIIYYTIVYILVRQKRFKLGKPGFFWPMLIVTLIVLYHNHSLSIRILGGSEEGEKPALYIYLFVLAYFCGINIPSPSVSFLSKVPLYIIILTGISNIPFLLTSFVPSLAPYLYRVTDNVNVGVYIDSLAGSSGVTDGAVSRLGALGQFGGVLQIYLLANYPIGTWLRPERWWIAILSFFCVMCAVYSGYRNVVFSFALASLIAVSCYYSWRALILPIALFIGMLVLLVASSNGVIPLPVNKIPIIAQRTLSFLPFDWDPEAIASSASSNEFRYNIQKVYRDEYMLRSPLLGNGFTINTKEFNALSDSLKYGGAGSDPEYTQAKAFIEGKLFHTGWISVYDAVGIIGTMAFIALGVSEVLVAAKFIFKPKADRRSPLFPLYIWIFVNVTTMMISFFAVFGDFGQIFRDLCVYGIVLSHLSSITSRSGTPSVLPMRKGQMEFSRLGGAQYGYQSKS